MNCKEAISLVHDYFDQELQSEMLPALHEHLRHCPSCERQFKQIEKTEALIQSLTKPQSPDGLTERVMHSVFPQQKKRKWLHWARRYPAFTVAVLFLSVMLGSIFALWNQGTDLRVQGADLDNLVIEGNRVIIPEGQTIHGDLIVENGLIQVDGTITGDLVVIDGSILTASTAQISGKITNVNQAIDWLWYKASELFSVMSGNK